MVLQKISGFQLHVYTVDTNMGFAGETLQDERVHGGAFVAIDGIQIPQKHMPVSSSPCSLVSKWDANKKQVMNWLPQMEAWQVEQRCFHK
jgi:hypothetical protein